MEFFCRAKRSIESARTKRFLPSAFAPILAIHIVLMFGVFQPVESSEPIEILIEQLDSPIRRERIAAKKNLLKHGRASLPVLQKLINSRSETPYELRTIVTQIRQQIANDSLAGSTVSFHPTKRATLREILNSLSKQTQFQIQVDPRVEGISFDLKLEEIRFWEAIDRISQRADVGWQINQSILSFTPKALLRVGAAAYPKCLRVAAFQRLPKQNLRNRDRQRLIRVHFRVDIEQGITPYYLRVRDQTFQLLLTDSPNDGMIAPFNPAAVRDIGVRNEPVFEFAVDFQTKAPLQAQPAKLKGGVELFCAAQSEIETISLEDSPSRSEHLKLVKVEKKIDELLITTQINLPKELATFDSHRMTLLHREVWLLQNNQQHIPYTTKRILDIQDQTHTVEFRFPSSSAVSHFAYSYPEFVTSLPVEFEINDLNVSAK